MDLAEWSFVVAWPVVVVVFNNLLAGQQMKHMANVTCENLNKTGRVLQMHLDSIRGIEEALGEHGIEITARVESKNRDVTRIAR
jgi:hypothetical protein